MGTTKIIYRVKFKEKRGDYVFQYMRDFKTLRKARAFAKSKRGAAIYSVKLLEDVKRV